VHYAWIVLAVVFSATLAGVGVRAAPGVMIIPLQRAFGWDIGTISAAVSLNIILLGATGPFLAGLIQVVGLKRTMLGCMMLLIAGTGLSNFMTAPWQLFATWGLMVGIGSGAGAVGIAAAVANRWFVTRNGLAMGLLTAYDNLAESIGGKLGSSKVANLEKFVSDSQRVIAGLREALEPFAALALEQREFADYHKQEEHLACSIRVDDILRAHAALAAIERRQ